MLQDFKNGDWFRFYQYYKAKDRDRAGSGVVGFYITFFLMFALTVFNGFLFYYYMVFIHMNGRILDLYRRLSGISTSFFVPVDQEVSLRYLQWVMHRTMTAKNQDYIIRSEDKHVFDKVGEEQKVQFV